MSENDDDNENEPGMFYYCFNSYGSFITFLCAAVLELLSIIITVNNGTSIKI